MNVNTNTVVLAAVSAVIAGVLVGIIVYLSTRSNCESPSTGGNGESPSTLPDALGPSSVFTFTPDNAFIDSLVAPDCSHVCKAIDDASCCIGSSLYAGQRNRINNGCRARPDGFGRIGKHFGRLEGESTCVCTRGGCDHLGSWEDLEHEGKAYPYIN